MHETIKGEQRAAAVGLIDMDYTRGIVTVAGNDYEELLRLDKTVARRGVSFERMKSIKIVNRKVPALDHSSCVICMEALVGKNVCIAMFSSIFM